MKQQNKNLIFLGSISFSLYLSSCASIEPIVENEAIGSQASIPSLVASGTPATTGFRHRPAGRTAGVVNGPVEAMRTSRSLAASGRLRQVQRPFIPVSRFHPRANKVRL